ncbi:hypothetical protein RMN57_13285 [Kitasatospora sp. CM 4170]|uniref:Minor tail protein n=1 Tax=Kitasatospora aburaviensis TaxID=67265 RepID=A0ABW1ESC7_9ACTN|nr:hypothetical protein [Kitasatospora sp. CM 4170]WNM45627.1 hypothetical protein RMN57_13285 [Kitasatospora sp. CM 4170]
MTVRSAWLLNPGQSRADTRLAPLGVMTPTGSTTTRAGVIPGGTPLLLTGTGMTGTIAVGRAVVQGTTTQGAYPVAVTVAENITVANGHASLPRIDSVFLVAYDQLYDTSGQTLAAITYTQGTANASPTAPTAPATGTAYLKLWDIAVPAGASAGSPINWGTALTDRRTYTTSLGSISPDGTTAGVYAGQYRDNSGTLERYSGSAWQTMVGVGAWTAQTPTWASLGGTQPSLGNGTLAARWTRAGRTVYWRGRLVMGSTTTGGSGLWFMSLPVAQAADFTVTGSMLYVANGNNYLGIVSANPSDAQGAAFAVKTGGSSEAGGNMSATVPLNIATGYTMLWSLVYEAAS